MLPGHPRNCSQHPIFVFRFSSSFNPLTYLTLYLYLLAPECIIKFKLYLHVGPLSPVEPRGTKFQWRVLFTYSFPATVAVEDNGYRKVTAESLRKMPFTEHA